jgi:signal transduction histidine kinase
MCLALLAWAAPLGAQDPTKSILYLYSSERDVAALSANRPVSAQIAIDHELERILRAQLGGSLYQYSEHIDPARLEDAEYVEDVLGVLRSKYQPLALDVIVLMGDTVVSLIAQHRADFFPAVPVVFSTADPVPRMSNATGVLSPMSQLRVLGTALQVQPDTQHVVIVAGATPFNRYYADTARREFAPYEGRLKFTYLIGLPVDELLQRVRALPPHSIILYMGVTQDGHGRMFLPHELVDSVSAVANAPIYSWDSAGLDHGLVGGAVRRPVFMAEFLAALTMRVLRGELAGTIPVREVDPTVTEFDWRQLRRWNISEARLPAQSKILFREPGIWEQYRNYVIGGALLFILQTGLIVGLVIQRTRRHRTERALRQSYDQNRDLAARLINAQEDERARIARDLHDDLAQQLAIVGIMLSSLKRKLARLGPDLDVEQTVSTLQDHSRSITQTVRSLSHELHPGVLEHTGLIARLRHHGNEIERHHPVRVTVTASGELDTIRPDVALCLFRVAQEAIANALRHSRAQRIVVDLAATPTIVALSISDDGVGFDVTGSRTGLGLRSVDERVRFLGGTVAVESRPGAGTTLRATLPAMRE